MDVQVAASASAAPGAKKSRLSSNARALTEGQRRRKFEESMLLPARDILSAIWRLKPAPNWWQDIGALVATKSVASCQSKTCEMLVQLGASATQGSVD